MSVFLFPGQGAQFSGMGMDLFESDTNGTGGIRALFAQTSEILGKDITGILNADAETLKRTDVSQIAITVVSLAAARALAARGIMPSACAGFSLGEYSALAVSGIISESDAVRLTFERGNIMQKIVDSLTGNDNSEQQKQPGMAAILGLAPAQIDAVISSGQIPDIYAANYNSPLQTVISGTGEALDAATTIFKEAGARRVVRLKVAGPFHSPLMAEAGKRFEKILETVTFHDPCIPVFSNVTGRRISSGEEAKKNAVAQISSPVRWTDEEALIADFLKTATPTTDFVSKNSCPLPDLIEVGPGKVLCGLWSDSKFAGICKSYTDVLNA